MIQLYCDETLEVDARVLEQEAREKAAQEKSRLRSKASVIFQRASSKHALRDACTWAAVVLTAPLWLPVWLEAYLGRGEAVFTACSEFLSLFPGLPGVVLRRGFYRQTLDRFATDCHLGFLTTIAHREVEIAEGVYIGSRCTLGRVAIEAHVTIGSNVDLLSGRRQHGFADSDVPVQQQGGTFEQIRIGCNSWLGNSSVVMADVGALCVIGAGSVVVKPIAAGVVAVGNPAMPKRHRSYAA